MILLLELRARLERGRDFSLKKIKMTLQDIYIHYKTTGSGLLYAGGKGGLRITEGGWTAGSQGKTEDGKGKSEKRKKRGKKAPGKMRTGTGSGRAKTSGAVRRRGRGRGAERGRGAGRGAVHFRAIERVAARSLSDLG